MTELGDEHFALHVQQFFLREVTLDWGHRFWHLFDNLDGRLRRLNLWLLFLDLLLIMTL